MRHPYAVNQFKAVDVGHADINDVNVEMPVWKNAEQVGGVAESLHIMHPTALHKALEAFEYEHMVVCNGHRQVLQYVFLRLVHRGKIIPYIHNGNNGNPWFLTNTHNQKH